MIDNTDKTDKGFMMIDNIDYKADVEPCEENNCLDFYGYINDLLNNYASSHCSVLCKPEMYACTRPSGHKGKHIAHGAYKQVCAVWEDGKDGKDKD